MKLWFSTILFILLIIPLAIAPGNHPYHLTLLAVQETDNGFIGSPADLYLEIHEGTGRVFLDTYPATKVDTQISTRFAKEIACAHYNLDYEHYDFIYTIKSSSSIIGGPSAGAAISALTTIGMMDLSYDDKIAITGTINSGAIVGPVGGVKEKIDAAQAAGLKKVLIAAGTVVEPSHHESIKTKETSENKNNTITIPYKDSNKNSSNNNHNNNSSNNPKNSTIANNTSSQPTAIPLPNSTDKIKLPSIFNFSSYVENNLTLKVVEVLSLDEVLTQLTGKNFTLQPVEISKNTQYDSIMQNLQTTLCDRVNSLQGELVQKKIKINQSIQETVDQKQGQAMNASTQGQAYSSASFCFSNSITLRRELYKAENLSLKEIKLQRDQLLQQVNSLKQTVKEEKIETISDLQTLMIVQERLHDVEEQEADLDAAIEKKDQNEAINILSYAQERFFSAMSWKTFFNMEGKKYTVDTDLLNKACTQKIAEAEELYQYTSLFLPPGQLDQLEEKLNQARGAQARSEQALCLIIASQVKGDANAVLNSFGRTEDTVTELFQSKQHAAQYIIAQNSANDIFPILGYSYYEYAQAFSQQEPFTGLLYLEYSLEMSDLGIYFPPEISRFQQIKWFFSQRELKLIGEGMIIGALTCLILCLLILRRGKNRHHSTKK